MDAKEGAVEAALKWVDTGAHPSHCDHFHALANEVRRLREDCAALLGYDNYAEWKRVSTPKKSAALGVAAEGEK